MSNYPCETVCNNCKNKTMFFLNSIQGHGGFRCKNCKIFILLPRMRNTFKPDNLGKQDKDYIYLEWYRKLYNNEKNEYGEVFEFTKVVSK